MRLCIQSLRMPERRQLFSEICFSYYKFRKLDAIETIVETFFAGKIKITIFAVPNAEIAQLVEHNLAKVGVAGPSPVFRSKFS